MITSEAWVIKRNFTENEEKIEKKTISFLDISDDEVLVSPIYGCLEGNISQAINRKPVNICEERNENDVVLGNAGVVKVIDIGRNVRTLKIGDYCILFCNSEPDEYGFAQKITGYDAVGSIGLFSKTAKFLEYQLIKIPSDNIASLKQWAAFSLRYITAWSNWKVAYACWKAQMPFVANDQIFVFAWGGGVSFAELTLAQYFGCKTFMLTSDKKRSDFLRCHNIYPLDRTLDSKDILSKINELTGDKGVSIFIDNIGSQTSKLTLQALGRQGVLTTCGWKSGTVTPILRPTECINRHIHVHTHYAAIGEGKEAVEFAIKNNWFPPIDNDKVYCWEDIPALIEKINNGEIISYFPLYSVNLEGG